MTVDVQRARWLIATYLPAEWLRSGAPIRVVEDEAYRSAT